MPKDSSPRKIVADRKRKTWGTVSTKHPKEISPWVKTEPHKSHNRTYDPSFTALMGWGMFKGRIRIL